MSHITETKLLEIAKWYEYNKDSIVDIQKRSEFLQTVVDNLLLLMINFCEDVKVLEGRGTIGNNSEIIVPNDVILKKNERKTQVQVWK